MTKRTGLGFGCLAVLAVFVGLIWVASQEPAVWDNASRRNTLASYQYYIAHFPAGEHAREARLRIASLPAQERAKLAKLTAAESNSWREISHNPTAAKITAHFDEYPDAPKSHHEEAVTLLLSVVRPSDADTAFRLCQSRLAVFAKQIKYDEASGSDLATPYKEELRHALMTRAQSRQGDTTDGQFVDQVIIALIDAPIIGVRFASRNASPRPGFFLPLFIEDEAYEGLNRELGLYHCQLAPQGSVTGPNVTKWPLVSLQYTTRPYTTYQLEGTGKVVASQCIDASLELYPAGSSVPSFKRVVTACPAVKLLVRGAFTTESELNDMLTESMKQSFSSALRSIGISR